METGHCTARNDDEEHGPDVLSVGHESLEGRKNNLEVLAPAHDHADGADDDREIEEVGGKVVPGLEKKPYGKDRREEDVAHKGPAPGLHGELEGLRHPGGIVPVPAGVDDDRDHDHGHEPQGHAVLVDQHAEQKGHADVQGGREGHSGVCREGSCGKLQEHGDNEDEGKDGEAEEEDLASPPDPFVHNFSHRFAVMAHGCHEGAHVVGTADESGADKAPQVGRKPSEHGGCGDGTDDGACAGDGCEMVPQKDGRMCRAVVDTVKHRFSRGRIVVVQIVDPGHVRTIHLITNCKQDDSNKEQDCEQIIHLRKYEKSVKKWMEPLFFQYTTSRLAFP